MTAQEILASVKGGPFGNAAQDARLGFVSGAIGHLYTLKGMTLPERERILATAIEAERMLAVSFAYLTFGELKAAFEQGVSGAFGENTIVSAANLVSWSRSFANLPERREALKMKNANPVTESSRLLDAATRESRNAEWLEHGAQRAWREYVCAVNAGRPFEIFAPGYGDALYQAMRGNGLFQEVKPATMAAAERLALQRWTRDHNGAPYNAEVDGPESLAIYIHTELVLMYFDFRYKAGKRTLYGNS